MPLLDKLISLTAPHYCLVCDREGTLLCAWCSNSSLLTPPSRCYKCQAATSDFVVCQKCRPKTALKHVWVRADYKGIAEQVLHEFKFERNISASTPVANAILEYLPYLDAETVVCSVPTASSRRRMRGYDQAALLAKHVAKSRQLVYLQPLARIGQSRQVGASRAMRYEQLQKAFILTRPQLIKGRKVLLIDDVLTTGATLETVASLLKQAGAKQVDAAVFAQKILTQRI